jgi:hypothetical protein
MASSSSAKKVARVAAKSGSGRPAGDPARSKNWLFYAGVIAIVALGAGIVAFARAENEGAGANDVSPRANLGDGQPSDHWHASFAINVCGTEVPVLQDGPTDVTGIHTHGDGLIHIHPFTRSAAGPRATMDKYFDQVGLTVTDEGFQLPAGLTLEEGGTTVKVGETTCGGEAGELVMAYWEDARTAGSSEPDEILRDGFDSIQFDKDLTAFTLAYVPEGSTDIPAPSSSAEIEALGAADAGGLPPNVDPATATVPEPIEPIEGEAPVEDTTETAPTETTPTEAETGGGQ